MNPKLKCPHCRDSVFVPVVSTNLGQDSDGCWILQRATCPSCGRFILELENGPGPVASVNRADLLALENSQSMLVRPRASARPPCPEGVPESLKRDCLEACLVLGDSPKASAALSRRCLQHLLRDTAKVKHSVLAAEIQEVLAGSALPSHLADALDAIRNIGNFAAHPSKSSSTGEIVAVEPGEAEWNLDVLEQLFDFYFVQPALLKKKRDALNKKLADAGRPPMK